MGEIDYRLLLGQPTQTPASESPLDVIGRMGQYQDARYQQQRQRSLADLARQTAGNYQDPTAQQYALGGFGEQAAQAQQAAIERQQAALKFGQLHRALTASRVRQALDSDSQEAFDKIAAAAPEDYGLKAGDTNWKKTAQGYLSGQISEEQRAQNENAALRWSPKDIVRQNALGQVEVVDPKSKTATVVDDNTKPVRPVAAKGLPGAPGKKSTQERNADRRDMQFEDAAYRDAQTTIEKGDGSHQFGTALQSLQNAKALKALNDGDFANPAMVQEATMALARLVTQGAPTEGTLHAMVPKTAGMQLADALQYITNSPQDAGAKKFLGYMMQTADREKALAEDYILNARVSNLRGKRLESLNPERYKSLLSPLGLTPELVNGYDGTPEGLRALKASISAARKGGAAKAGPSAAQLSAAQKWLDDPKSANDPRRAAVAATLKRHSDGG